MRKVVEQKFLDLLKKYSSEERINHSISTANFMKKYSYVAGVDEEKAYLAGLLHDIARELNHDEVLKLSENFIKRNIINIQNFEEKKEYPVILHGIASAEIIIKELDIWDKEILEAACTHTLGGKNLSSIAKYTFIADFCEPLRKNRASKKVLKILIKEKDFNKAYLFTYKLMMTYLIKTNKILFKDTIEGYNEALFMY